MNFGDFFITKRKSQKLTLRKFCESKGYDPGYISRLENSIIAAPKDSEKLKALATALGIKPDTQDWVNFFDLASTSQGAIPKDIVKEMPDLINHLPAFCRKIGNKKITDQDIDTIIKLLYAKNKSSDSTKSRN